MIHYITAGLILLRFDDIWALKLTGVIPAVFTVAFLHLLLRNCSTVDAPPPRVLE